MAILEGDIKLLKSQVMDDVEEGGGRSNGVAIVDGASNSIFPDISELDRAYGRVNLRKVFVSVDTPTVDSYFGVNVIISDPPDDSKVSCTLFTTKDGFDRRTSAKSQLESYVIAGPFDAMIPYGKQIAGQKIILVYQREESAIPEVGQVFALGTETGTIIQQLFRIAELTSNIQVFEDLGGTFSRRVIYITASEPLRYTFPGDEPHRVFNSTLYPLSSRVRKTSVADAANYYGTRPISAAAMGSLAVKADTIYTQLVPSSTVETPLISENIRIRSPIIKSGNQVEYPNSVWSGSPRNLYLGGGIAPRTLVVTTGSVDENNPKGDDGAGNITTPSGAIVGSVDYSTGIVSPIKNSPAWSASETVKFTYGAVQHQSSFNDMTPVSVGNRGGVHIKTLSPIPSPGTTVVDFMAMGRWFQLRDEKCDGVLSGDELSVGVGTINYTTGAVLVTLGALPDVGSCVMYAWGSAVDNHIRTASHGTLYSEFLLGKFGSAKSTLSISVMINGELKTLTESGGGVLTGGGLNGLINYSTGAIVFNGVVDMSSNITAKYSFGSVVGTPTVVSESFTDIAREVDTKVKLRTTSLSPLIPNTVRLEWVALGASAVGADRTSNTYLIKIEDDGLGNLKKPDGTIIGTVDYSSGILTFQPRTSVLVPVATYTLTDMFGAGEYAPRTVSYDRTTSTSVDVDAPFHTDFKVKYQTGQSTATLSLETENFAPTLKLNLVANNAEPVVQGSVVFKIGTTRYVDRSGSIYRNVDPATGSGVLSGSIDYTTGTVTLTSWVATAPMTVSIESCLTFVSDRGTASAVFRTAGAPLRPSSFYVQATAIDGTLVTGFSDENGSIEGQFVKGTVKTTTGIVSVIFGSTVPSAGNESAWWYLAANVKNGQIFKPKLVFADTIRYNAVVTSALPLDALILGIDPVRLPSDGRVPIIRKGDMCVVHHTSKTTPQTVSNGQTVSVGRTRLAKLRVIDNTGATIGAGYSTNLDAGTVTFSNVAGFIQPIRIEHRIEDMSLASDAQINGDVSFARQLTHDFPIGSYISSALVIGDMKSRVNLTFDQATWDGQFIDAMYGSPATGTYNDVIAPIDVTNKGAITERWVVRFTNSTTYEIIGDHVGNIATGNTTTDCAPINPSSGSPYFAIKAIGWGSGWAAGNVLRFNTIGTLYPVWIARTIQQGSASSQDDSFTILIRGDIDRP